MKSAKLIQVIVTESTIGEGEDRNPFRGLTQYWSPDGALLAERDAWREDAVKRLRESAADLLVRLKQSEAAVFEHEYIGFAVRQLEASLTEFRDQPL